MTDLKMTNDKKVSGNLRLYRRSGFILSFDICHLSFRVEQA